MDDDDNEQYNDIELEVCEYFNYILLLVCISVNYLLLIITLLYELQVIRSKETSSHLCFLQNILEPYIEAYWLTGAQLLELKGTVHKSNHDNNCYSP